MSKRVGYYRSVAFAAGIGLLGAAMVHVPANAAPTVTESDVSSATSEAIEAQGKQLDATYNFIGEDGVLTTQSGVEIRGNSLQLADGLPNIELPVSSGVEPTIADDGSAVYLDSTQDLGIQVEAAEDGIARVLTVAGEGYSDTDEHRYTYNLELPEGAKLDQAESGTVFILAPASTIEEDDETVDLTEVLPDSTGVDEVIEDEEESEIEAASFDPSSIASVDELGGDYDVPSGWAVVGGFQEAWSSDASGEELDTHYEIQGNQLTQIVDTSEAAFPVTSDPIPLVAIGLGAVARAIIAAALRSGAKAVATQTIRAGVSATTRGGYKTFSAFKKDLVRSAPKNNQWHHIVEQGNIAKRGWNPRWIHNRNNLVSIPKEVHQKCVNSWMAKKNVSKFGVKSGNKTMRQVVRSQSFSKQHSIGVALLKHCGVTF